MPRVVFIAWVNRADPNDPGHLTMVHGAGQALEYAMGAGPAPTNHSSSVGIPVVAPGAPPSQGRHLAVIHSGAAASATAQRAKQRGGRDRFTHVLVVEEDVTDQELAHIRKMSALRMAVGVYSFLREFQVRDPFATRCLSSLEDLASLRGQRLGVGKAQDLLSQFATLNNLGFKIRSLT